METICDPCSEKNKRLGGVAKGYRCEDQALEINRKVCVGGSFGVDMRGESLQK
jgi:hypothetical protein